MRCPRFASILYRGRRMNPVWGHLIRPFGALTGACRPGLAENSALCCFPGARPSLHRGGKGGRRNAAPTGRRTPYHMDERHIAWMKAISQGRAAQRRPYGFCRSPATGHPTTHVKMPAPQGTLYNSILSCGSIQLVWRASRTTSSGRGWPTSSGLSGSWRRMFSRTARAS